MLHTYRTLALNVSYINIKTSLNRTSLFASRAQRASLSIQQVQTYQLVFRVQRNGRRDVNGTTWMRFSANVPRRCIGMDAYPITSEDPVVRRKFAESIFEILRPLTASEMPRSRATSDDESSQCSALSDPFSDLDETYVMLDQRKKKPGTDEGDEMLLMNQFTPEFRSTYDELMGSNRLRSRAEVSVENSLDKCTTPRASEGESKSSFVDIRSGDFSPKFRSFIDEMLAKCDLQHHLDEKKRKEQQQHKKDRRVRTIVSEESFCGLETDSLSGIWRMLDAVSEDECELLPVSGPNYDLYYDRRFDWMTRDEIPWEQVEASKKKCEQWLKIPVISTTDSLKPK